MAYTPTTWVAGVTALGPTNLNKLESGLQVAAAVADAAIPKPGAPTDRDVLYYDLATTSWKNAKITDAMVAAGAGIAKSKLAALAIADADVAVGAAINPNKLASGVGAQLGQFLGADPSTGVIGFFAGAELISDTVLGVAAANIDIQNIPAIYKHLLIIAQTRCSDVAAQALFMKVNNDAGASYDYQYINAAAAAVTSAEGIGVSGGAAVGLHPGTGATAGFSAPTVIFIPNYAGTTFDKGYVSLTNNILSGATGQDTLRIHGGHWRTTATAINRLEFHSGVGNLIAGSRITIYGIG